MKTTAMLVVTAVVTLSLATPQSHAQAKGEVGVVQLLTCQESWMEWKDDPVKKQKFVDALKENFKENERERDGSFVPIKPMSILGHQVFRLYPQSVGMGVGYSVIVNASFEATKASVEKEMGKPFDRCDAAADGKLCERELAKQKTVMMMEASRGKDPKTLLGCYYFYAK